QRADGFTGGTDGGRLCQRPRKQPGSEAKVKFQEPCHSVRSHEPDEWHENTKDGPPPARAFHAAGKAGPHGITHSKEKKENENGLGCGEDWKIKEISDKNPCQK